LMENGLSPSTPVALIRRVSHADQQVVRCDLGSVASTIDSIPGFRPPVISIVGEVVRLATKDHSEDHKPLAGRTYVWAGTESAGQSQLARLRALGATVWHCPAIEIVASSNREEIDRTLRSLSQYGWIVFSSVHGVDYFFEAMHRTGLDARALGGIKIASVGTTTSATLAKWHIHADRTPQTQGMEALLDVLLPEVDAMNLAGKGFLMVRTETGKEIGMERLGLAGAKAIGLNVYNQQFVTRWPEWVVGAIEAEKIDGVIATSANVAEAAKGLIGPAGAGMTWFCISKAAADVLADGMVRSIVVAEMCTLDSIVDSIVKESGK
jgi:uroporphyrinogen III methyltransferase / synthase